jgi:hypothetical protein
LEVGADPEVLLVTGVITHKDKVGFTAEALSSPVAVEGGSY